MENIVRGFCEKLNIAYSEELITFYKEGELLLQKDRDNICNKEKIICLSKKYNIFRNWLNEVTEAADIIKNNDLLMLYIAILICIIRRNGSHILLHREDEDPQADFVPLFSFVYLFDDMISAMEKRGLPYKIISDTLYEFDSKITDYYDMYGRPGVKRYVGWLKEFAEGKILRIGRLNFEMTTLNCKIRAYQKDYDIKILMDGEYMHYDGMVFGSAGQDDEAGRYYADIEEDGNCIKGYAVNSYGECVPQKICLYDYNEIARRGDNVLSVHIPSHEPLSEEICEQTYQQAKEVFEKYYPEFQYKTFICVSWMMEKRLKQIMGRDTNITRFADKYNSFPIFSTGKGSYSFLFGCQNKDINPCDLPEKNSMQRAVKSYICDGNIFHEKGGLFVK